jgi:hypothetical protein
MADRLHQSFPAGGARADESFAISLAGIATGSSPPSISEH